MSRPGPGRRNPASLHRKLRAPRTLFLRESSISEKGCSKRACSYTLLQHPCYLEFRHAAILLNLFLVGLLDSLVRRNRVHRPQPAGHPRICSPANTEARSKKEKQQEMAIMAIHVPSEEGTEDRNKMSKSVRLFPVCSHPAPTVFSIAFVFLCGTYPMSEINTKIAFVMMMNRIKLKYCSMGFPTSPRNLLLEKIGVSTGSSPEDCTMGFPALEPSILMPLS
eukprot:09761_6